MAARQNVMELPVILLEDVIERCDVHNFIACFSTTGTISDQFGLIVEISSIEKHLL